MSLHDEAAAVADRVARAAARRFVRFTPGELLGVAFVGALAALERWRPDGGASPSTWATPAAWRAVEAWTWAELRRRDRFRSLVVGFHDVDQDEARHVEEERAIRSALTAWALGNNAPAAPQGSTP